MNACNAKIPGWATGQIVIFPDVGHAFQNPNNKKGYRPQDTEDAWNKTVAFLQTNLKGGK